MNKPMRITTPGGEKLVILSEKEYRRLTEAAGELADIAAFDEASRELDEGAGLVSFEEMEKRIARRLKDAS